MGEAAMAFSQFIPPLSFLAFVTPAFAYESFQPNCTIPDTAVNIVSSPSVRGTYDILWSSMFTLLVCTWTIQHLNIPKQSPDCTTWRQSLKENVKRVRARLKWMLLTFIMPEFLVGKALQDFMRARNFCREVQEFCGEDEVSWTMTHSFYADMGGFVYQVVDSDKQAESNTLTRTTTSPEAVESHRASADKIDGLEIVAGAIQPSQPTRELDESKQQRKDHIVYVCIDAKELARMRRNGIIQRLPEITEKEILDKSKGDAFAKGLAVVQVLWLIVQVISRAAKGLPISQLEIAVLAFSACAVLIYALLWYKPQNVGAPTYVKKPLRGERYRDSRSLTWFISSLPLLGRIFGHDVIHDDSTIPNDVCYPQGPFAIEAHAVSYLNMGLVIGGTIFGAIHFLAWGFQFPSYTDTLLWRISAITCTGALPGYYVSFFYREFVEASSPNSIILKLLALISSVLSFGLVICLFIVYIFARLCLIVLVVRSLFCLPPEAFLSTWSSQIPHV
jgi:hypothetical protein